MAELNTYDCPWCREVTTSVHKDGIIDCEWCGQAFDVDDDKDDY